MTAKKTVVLPTSGPRQPEAEGLVPDARADVHLESLTRLISCCLPYAVVATDLTGIVTFVNPSAEQLLGLCAATSVGQPFQSPFETVTTTSAEVTHVSPQPTKGGSEIIRATMLPCGGKALLEWTVGPLLDAAGLAVGKLFTARDVTQRQTAVAHEQMLAAFPKWNPNPVLEFGADGRLRYFNEAALEMTASLGHSTLESILPDGVPEIVAHCLSTGEPRVRLEQEHGERVISWSFFPIRSLGAVHCYAGDVTERHTLEQQFRQSQKLESLGRLAGGVAHDFNNLLTVIKGQASCVATGELPEGAEAEALQHILQAAERGSNLTRQLLTFSRQNSVQFRSVDLNEAVRNIDRLLSRVVGEQVEFVLRPAPTVPPIWADVSMIEQILLNLAVNSRDAMPNGGRIFISTEPVTVGPEYEARNPDIHAGTFVRLTVEDTGNGIPPEHLPRIFEPFFSTKPASKGTGLGLATVYGIVKQHHGWIRVFSDVGRGTTFQIHLPSTTHPIQAEMMKRQASPTETKGGHESILVVEDEGPVRRLIAGALRARGYRVHEAQNGAGAMDVFEKLGGEVDLLLADVVMPGGMNGRELAVQLARKKTDLRVLLITGYSSEPGNEAAGRDGFPCLAKPFDLDDLHRSLRAALAR